MEKAITCKHEAKVVVLYKLCFVYFTGIKKNSLVAFTSITTTRPQFGPRTSHNCQPARPKHAVLPIM